MSSFPLVVLLKHVYRSVARRRRYADALTKILTGAESACNPLEAGLLL
eukprot:SAG31_NODE_2498_length_5598_cov_2.801600_4_plen_48_part_00